MGKNLSKCLRMAKNQVISRQMPSSFCLFVGMGALRKELVNYEVSNVCNT